MILYIRKQEQCEDTIGVVRNRNWKERPYDGQKRKDKQQSTKILQKTKHGQHEPQ